MRYALALLGLAAATAALVIVLWWEQDHKAGIIRLGITPRPTPTPAPSTTQPTIVNPIGDCTPR